MKKQITCTAILSAAMVLTGCAGGSGDGQTDAKGGEKTAKIGIVQFAEHPALDASYEGFVDTMKEAGYSEDSFDYKNAQGDQSNCTTIAQTFVNDGDDLIYAIATPAAQAAANETSDIPILVSA
ncbi:ABC transporter substrate binding protein, partial [Faecalibaculum rodentium]